jgi:4-hydroxy-tetrahydrodipicolinate reductase
MSSRGKEIRLAIVGASGRMGQELRALATEVGGFALSLGVSPSSAPGFARVATALDCNHETSGHGLGHEALIDVVVDFSLPEATKSVAAWCATHGKPLVSGVTGLGEAERAALAQAASAVATLWAPNMSLGVAVMAQMLKAWARLEGFQFQIEELHHKHKKDRPSGTALFLQRQLEESVGGPQPAPLSIRGGGIFGIHRAWAMGEEETVSIEHVAMNRRVFARGALAAAKWIADKPPGLYAMADMLA